MAKRGRFFYHNQAQRLKESIRDLKKDIQIVTIRRKQDLARKTLSLVVDLSPVDTGSYALSHRVGINKTDQTVSQASSRRSESKDQRAAIIKPLAIQKQMPKIFLSKRIFDKIIISNAIHYAREVEYVGWEITPPYHVYSKTVQRMAIHIARSRYLRAKAILGSLEEI